MKENILDLLGDNPIIAAIKDDEGLANVVNSSCNIVFILYGNLCSIANIVHQIKQAGKYAFVHVDLIDGASNKEIVIDFIKQTTGADGVISTKSSLIKAANTRGLYTVHRFFLIDSMSFHNVAKQVALCSPDCVEIMPGCMPKVLKSIQKVVNVPIIAGGLVTDKEDVVAALGAGADAISSTSTEIWDHI
ncbi:glycerol-3-phosphate responsive antiterminator [Caproiciproducens sp.]|uniref:glycerol-3-phosphate responsive antiterminator n=1 Tax=Caproiciproducens sp. TaxID=1954376 RepID=UPI0028A07F52|nr:glycerol-3-phosphate responsive antiterminator [Caproiciproducens sp.]